MTCTRCQGLIVQDSEQGWLHWKCTSCGDRFDLTVLNNRWLYRELKALEVETRLRVPTSF